VAGVSRLGVSQRRCRGGDQRGAPAACGARNERRWGPQGPCQLPV